MVDVFENGNIDRPVSSSRDKNTTILPLLVGGRCGLTGRELGDPHPLGGKLQQRNIDNGAAAHDRSPQVGAEEPGKAGDIVWVKP